MKNLDDLILLWAGKDLPKMQDRNDTGLIIGIRFWLIRILAGKSVVILNTVISVTKNSGAVVVVRKLKGGFIQNCMFNVNNLDGSYLIEQTKEVKASISGNWRKGIAVYLRRAKIHLVSKDDKA